MAAPDHFKPRDLVYTEEDKRNYPRVPELPKEPTNYMNVLWTVASWFVVLINMAIVGILIRDMYLGGYNPLNHWFATSAVVATICGLALVNSKVIKR